MVSFRRVCLGACLLALAVVMAAPAAMRAESPPGPDREMAPQLVMPVDAAVVQAEVCAQVEMEEVTRGGPGLVDVRRAVGKAVQEDCVTSEKKWRAWAGSRG